MHFWICYIIWKGKELIFKSSAYIHRLIFIEKNKLFTKISPISIPFSSSVKLLLSFYGIARLKSILNNIKDWYLNYKKK